MVVNKAFSDFEFAVRFLVFHSHLQTDTIYSPMPGASMDAPDAPCPTPLDVVDRC